MNVTSSALAGVLRERFDTSAAADLDVIVGFAWPAQGDPAPAPALRCAIHAGELEILADTPPTETDFTLYFRDEAHAIALLKASVSPIDAFMAGEFRSSGYIVWSFRTLAAFARVG